MYLTIGKRLLWKKTLSVRFRGKTYMIDPNRPAYANRKRFIYIVDINRGQLDLNNVQNPISADMVDAILTRSVVRQLVGQLETSSLSLQMIGLILLGLLAGIPLGIVLSPFVMGG